MTIRAVAIILIRLWGLSTLVYGLFGLIAVVLPPYAAQADATTRQFLALSLTGSIVSLVVATVLLTATERIADWIAPEPVSAIDPDHYSTADLQAIAFGAVGAYLLIHGVADAVALLYAIARQPAWDAQNQFAYALEGRQQDLARATVQLILAAILLLNRRALAAFRDKLRATPSTS